MAKTHIDPLAAAGDWSTMTRALTARVEAARESGDRDAWFAAVNQLRRELGMAPKTRAEFDAAHPA